MANKPLREMSFSELSVELADATAQEQAADYQEQLSAWRAAMESARARKAAVTAEIDLRLSRLAAAGGVPAPGEPSPGEPVEEQKHGG